jgi:hypothetical protein
MATNNVGPLVKINLNIQIAGGSVVASSLGTVARGNRAEIAVANLIVNLREKYEALEKAAQYNALSLEAVGDLQVLRELFTPPGSSLTPRLSA